MKTVRIPDLGDLHSKIATDVWPNGAKLRCNKCGHAKRITVAEAGEYLRSGWPTHCGNTMTLERT